MKTFVNSGADIIIGRGLSKIVPFEYYNKSLIFYSLGYFITDSKLANELIANSKGVLLGIDISETDYNVYLFPINIISGYPMLMDVAERRDFFSSYVPLEKLPASVYSVNYDKALISISR